MPSKSILGNQENGRAGFIGMATIFCEKNKYLIYMYIQTNGKQQQTYFLMLNTVSYENITNSSFLLYSASQTCIFTEHQFNWPIVLRTGCKDNTTLSDLGKNPLKYRCWQMNFAV